MDEEDRFWLFSTLIVSSIGAGIVYVFCEYKDITFIDLITGNFDFTHFENPLNEYKNYTSKIPSNNSVPLGDGIQEPLAMFF